ncbi:MAG: hypothetical protein R2755_22090 [Acidimicrobiales bacterium]
MELLPRLQGVDRRHGEHAWMLRIATDAERDAPLGAAFDDIDNHLDDLQRSFMAAMFEAHDRYCAGLAHSVQLALVARFERIGDHAGQHRTNGGVHGLGHRTRAPGRGAHLATCFTLTHRCPAAVAMLRSQPLRRNTRYARGTHSAMVAIASG